MLPPKTAVACVFSLFAARAPCKVKSLSDPGLGFCLGVGSRDNVQVGLGRARDTFCFHFLRVIRGSVVPFSNPV